MRSNGDRSNRSPVKVLPQKTHCVRLRIVMIAFVRDLAVHRMESGFVQQMPRKLSTRAGQIRTVSTVPREHPPDPPMRTEQQQQTGDHQDRHWTATPLQY